MASQPRNAHPPACGARRPGFELRPAIGRWSLACALTGAHDGDHANVFGDKWPNLADVLDNARDGDLAATAAVLDAMADVVAMCAGANEDKRQAGRFAVWQSLRSYSGDGADFTAYVRSVL